MSLLSLLPGWPLLMVDADFTAGPPNVVGGNRVSLNSLSMGVGQMTASHGRQYELGQCQAGTASLVVEDPKELLNPANTTSPFNTGANKLLPYRAFRASALWPLGGNIINPNVNASYDPGFTSGLSTFAAAAGTTISLSTTQAMFPPQSMKVVQGSTGLNNGATLLAPSAPDTTFTVSAYIYPTGDAAVTLTVTGATATASSTVAATPNTWQRVTATYTGDSAVQTIRVGATGTGTPTYYVDAVQLELAGQASVFTATGPTRYYVHSGWIERYPQEWKDVGMWGTRPLQSVDALSVLSRTVMRQSYASTIAVDRPQVFIPFDDQAFPQTVQRPTGGQPMFGYTELGSNSGSVNFAGDSFLDGSKAVTISQQNASPVTRNDNTMVTFLGTRQGALSVNTQSFTLEMWVKFSSGTAYFGAGSMQPGETTIGEVAGTQKGYAWYTSRGNLSYHYLDPNGGNSPIIRLYQDASTPWNGYPDDKWHYLVLMFPGGSTTQHYIDGVTGTVTAMAFTPSANITVDNFHFEATTYWGDALTALSVANVAAYPKALSAAQLGNHYRRGIGYLGEKSGVRAQRLLNQYWASNFLVLGNGVTTLSADYDYDGRTVLDALTEIAGTETGLVYANSAGAVVVEDRDQRYRAQTAQWVFGERADLGELPYVNIAYDYDPTYLYSQVQASSPGGATFTVTDNAAQTAYGQRILSTTLHTDTDWNAQQYAAAYGKRYSTPRLRVNKLTLDPSANPALWPAALGIEISQRITVKRRTAAGVTISGDYYVEQISHSIDPKTAKWTVDLQVSPVFVPNSWILGDATFGVLGSSSICVY